MAEKKKLGSFPGDRHGLNPWSQKLFAELRVVLYTIKSTVVYPDGRQEPLRDQLVTASLVEVEPIEGTTYYDYCTDDFGPAQSRYQLFRYILPDGRVYVGWVQDRLEWKYGISTYFALKDKDGTVVPESMWTPQEIAASWNGNIPPPGAFPAAGSSPATQPSRGSVDHLSNPRVTPEWWLRDR